MKPGPVPPMTTTTTTTALVALAGTIRWRHPHRRPTVAAAIYPSDGGGIRWQTVAGTIHTAAPGQVAAVEVCAR